MVHEIGQEGHIRKETGGHCIALLTMADGREEETGDNCSASLHRAASGTLTFV
jgi:hypothetical protein